MNVLIRISVCSVFVLSTVLHGYAQSQEKSSLSTGAVRNLVQSMARLLPTTDQKPTQIRKLEKAAELFAKQKTNECQDMLKTMRDSDATLPPNHLLISAMYFSTNDVQNGRAHLELTATQTPEYPSTYGGFARIALATNRLTDADALLTVMDSKIRKNQWTQPQNEQFRIEYLDIKSQLLIRRNRLTDAKACLTSLIKLLPNDTTFLIRQARVFFAQKDDSGALGMLQKVYRNNQNSIATPRLVLANWYKDVSDFANYEIWLSSAVRENSSHLDVQVAQARWLIDRQRYEDASKWLEKAKSNGADQTSLNYLHGKIAFLKKNWDEAEKRLNQAHLKKPSDTAITTLLALTLSETNDPKKQRRALELAKINLTISNSSLADSVVGWVFYQAGDEVNAARHLDRVSRRQKISADSAYFIAQFLADHAQNKKAKLYLDEIAKHSGQLLYRKQAEALTDLLTNK